MKAIIFLVFIIIVTNLFAQETNKIETRLNKLEITIDSLRFELQVLSKLYDLSAIYDNTIRSRLALELNRNFTYFAFFYKGKFEKVKNGYQQIYYFDGYRSEIDHNSGIKENQSHYLKTIRQNLSSIIDIVVGKDPEPIKYEDGTVLYPSKLIINYFNNSSPGNPLIVADTDKKSLKVRINGILKEVGWE